MKTLNLSFILLVLMALASGCESEVKPSDVFGINGSDKNTIQGGCESATAIDQTRIQVNYHFPSNATMGKIHANGLEVASIPNPGSGSIIIPGLLEGLEYTFRCYGIINGVNRESEKSAVTKVINRLAPQFNGLESAELGLPGFAQLSWQEPGTAAAGVAALTSYFKVRTFRGPIMDEKLEILPAQTAYLGQTSMTVGQFGDELDLTFHISACTMDHVCDSNAVSKSVSIPQYMKPINTKALKASGVLGSTVNGLSVVQIDVAWDHTKNYGGLAKRQLYVTTNPNHNNDIANFELYSVTNVVTYDPASAVYFSSAEEGKTYFFIVRGMDRAEQVDENSNVVALKVPDLTPAIFDGIKDIALGTNKETDVVVTFNTIDHNDQRQVVNYRLYYTQKPFGLEPSNACASNNNTYIDYGVANLPVNSQNQTITFSQGSPRTKYDFCLKTIDASGNISKTTMHASITTLDQTAPAFAGAQSDSLTYYNGNTATPNTIKVRFPVSSAGDLNNYKLTFKIKNLESEALSEVTKIVGKDLFIQSCNATACSVNYGLTDGVFGENQEISVAISACDDAFILPSGQSNCSLTLAESNKVTTGDMTGPQFLANSLRVISHVEGGVQFSWTNPAALGAGGKFDSTQLSYFKIFIVDIANDTYENLIPKTSANTVFKVDCVDRNCPTTFTVSGLEVYKNYDFVMMAFDASGNPSPRFVVKDVVMSLQTKDSTSPTFSALSLSYDEAALSVISPAAWDNQYLNVSNMIYYKVYFKKSLDYTAQELTNPPASLISSTFSFQTYSEMSMPPNKKISFAIPLTSMSQGDYFYTVCALDQSGNKKCMGLSSKLTIKDLVPPTIDLAQAQSLYNAGVAKTSLEKGWKIALKINDQTNDVDTLSVKVYQLFSESESAVVSQSNFTNDISNLFSKPDPDSLGNLTSSPIYGQANCASCFAHYLVRVSDGVNVTELRFKTSFSTLMTAEAATYPTQVQVNQPSLVIIKGAGFSHQSLNGISSSVIINGTTACTKMNYISDKYMACSFTPTQAGEYVIRVTDATGSAVSTKVTASNTSTCTPSGTGTSYDPMIICSVAQFMTLTTDLVNGFSVKNKYFKLGSNLDFSGIKYKNINSIGGSTDSTLDITTSVPQFNGNDYFLMNIDQDDYRTESGFTGVGLFSTYTSGSSAHKFANLNIFNYTDRIPVSQKSKGVLIGYATGLKIRFEKIQIFKNIEDTQSQIIVGSATSATLGSGSIAGGGSTSIVSFSNVRSVMDITGSGVSALKGGFMSTVGTLVELKNVSFSGKLEGGSGIINRVSATNCLNSECIFSDIESDVRMKTAQASGALPNYGSLFGILSLTQKTTIKNAVIKFDNRLLNGGLSFGTYSQGGLIGRVTAIASPLLISNVKVINSYFKFNNNTYTTEGVGGLIGTVNFTASTGRLDISNTSLSNNEFSFTGNQTFGGFVGSTTAATAVTPEISITNSAFASTITNPIGSQSFYAGGFLGFTAAGNINITKSIVNGCLKGSLPSYRGGLVAKQANVLTINTTGAYFNRDHSSNDCNGFDSSYGNGGFDYTSNDLLDQTTFPEFDFTTIWNMGIQGPEVK